MHCYMYVIGYDTNIFIVSQNYKKNREIQIIQSYFLLIDIFQPITCLPLAFSEPKVARFTHSSKLRLIAIKLLEISM